MIPIISYTTNIRSKSAPVKTTCRIKASTSKLFSLLIWLPDEQVRNLKDLCDGVTILQVKQECELIVGLPSSCVDIQLTDGTILDDHQVFRLNENATPNMLIKVKYKPLYESIRTMIEDCSIFELEGFMEKHDDMEILFALLFMCSFYGKTTLCTSIIRAGSHELLSKTTSVGNTVLHAACSRDRVSTALHLSEKGSDMHKSNNKGLTALDCALLHGAVTCERKLRLSQWSRRAEQLNNTAEVNETARSTESEDEPRYQPVTIRITTYSEDGDAPTDHVSSRHRIDERPEICSRPTSKSVRQRELLNDNSFSARCLVKRKAVSASARHNVNQESSSAGNVRLCVEHAEEQRKKEQQQTSIIDQPQKERFKMTRPQYTQYIKSATGIVEEDYFADIFPSLDEEKQNKKKEGHKGSFDEQTARNARIFRKMFRNSGLMNSSDEETDSEEELKRHLLNDRAMLRWKKKKQIQEEEERKKRLLIPAAPSQGQQKQCLDSLMMIGDTSKGSIKIDSSASDNLHAYKNYAREKNNINKKSVRIQSAPVSRQLSVDPETYHEWLDSLKQLNLTKAQTTAETKSTSSQPNLRKKIDYNTWLEEANKKLAKSHYLQKREAQQKKDFEEWVKQLKEEVGTFNYWLRNKEAKLKEEREKQNQREQRKQEIERQERRRKENESKAVYREWMMNKERSLLRREQMRLEQERRMLQKMK